MNSVEEVIAKTKALIKEKGWIQKRYVSPDGYCISGALQEVVGRTGERNFDLLHNAAYIKIYNHLGGEYGTLSSWNDAPGRTKEEVLALLDEALKD